MTRYIGIKQNRICIVSSDYLFNNDLEIREVPDELSHLSASELILQCSIKDGLIKCKRVKKSANQLKVAFVTNYRMRCGLSTYAENLFPEIIKHVKDFKLFLEKNDLPTGNIYEIGSEIYPEDKVSVCWKRGESLKQLISELKNYDPDIILINHEHGLWSNAAYWMSMMTQLSDYRIIVIMHSVFPNHKDKTIVEACIPEIVVHLEEGKNTLIRKGISNPIHVVMHGCYEHSDEKLWNFYKTDHTIIQMGFGFRYKNFEQTILACSLLKDKYPDIFLSIIFSESPQNVNEHQIYYNELVQLIEQLSLQENVAIIRGFQSDNGINSYLRTNRVAVFPYQSNQEHLVYGASGAARLAMAANLPVISSSIPHFSDLPTIKCDSAKEIAQELDKLFFDSQAYQNQLEKQKSFIIENSWSKVAEKFIKIFESNY